ncbi:ATP-binding protein [Candidatus Woesearchaeota archaeon]|nr:ATP-binding protein [Candidatus Woesearchaeota archaeon]
MGNKIIIGRNEADKKEFGEAGTVYIGKLFVNMGQTTALSNEIFLDVVRTHVLLISGKRGSGKSYSASVIAEEMSRLPADVKKNITVLFFDTMGVFWTMKYPNTRQEDLLVDWSLTAEGLPITLFTPQGHYQQQKERGIPVDKAFALKTSELSAGDWCNVFDIKLTDPLGIAIERALDVAHTQKRNYDIPDLIATVQKDQKSTKEVKDAVENRLLGAKKWGLFAAEGTTIDALLQPGSVNVLDISTYTNTLGNWSVKGLIIGLISRKLLEERMKARKIEEVAEIQKHKSYFFEDEGQETPMVWIMIDEAHEFLPRVGKTPATDALVQLLREGRQPGISLCLVTQQPGEIHHDVMTQTDIVISHRLTAQRDIVALNSMMQSYLVTDLQDYLNNLPRDKGAALLLDDNSERIYPMRVHPKRSWHGGDAPSAIKTKKKILEF